MVVSFKGARCIIETLAGTELTILIQPKKTPRILSFNVGQDINLLRWKSKLKFHFYKKLYLRPRMMKVSYIWLQKSTDSRYIPYISWNEIGMYSVNVLFCWLYPCLYNLKGSNNTTTFFDMCICLLYIDKNSIQWEKIRKNCNQAEAYMKV